jgi:hypothetical protein
MQIQVHYRASHVRRYDHVYEHVAVSRAYGARS